MNYVDFRCGKCGKLLGRIRGDAEIKCPRCNSLNILTNQQPCSVSTTAAQPMSFERRKTGSSCLSSGLSLR